MTPIRRKSKIRHLPKPKILLDEGLPPRTHFKDLNNYCNVKHIKHDYRLGGATDSVVYAVSQRHGRVLVTFNPNDFRSLIAQSTMSVIGLSMHLTNEDIDKKLSGLLRQLKPSQLKGQYFSITKQSDKGLGDGSLLLR